VGAPEAVLLSYRLGGHDGVSVEADKWERALQALGFRTRRVAGSLAGAERPEDHELPFLAITSEQRFDAGRLEAALAGADLVVVENLCSVPLNREAALGAADVLRWSRGRVLLHHHDLPWERPELGDVPGLPPTLPRALHVVISEAARAALERRGIDAVVIRNAFDVAARGGDRDATRRALAVGDDDLLVLQPTRAIARKGVDAGLAFAARLGNAIPDRPVRYWLTGPAEDGYGPTLRRLIAAARVPVLRGRAARVADAYAAADLVVMPSSWEGFGNPVVEAVLAGRPVAAAPYPVLAELVGLGLRVLPLDPAVVAAFLADPDAGWLAANRARAAASLSVECLPARLAGAFEAVGWSEW
jgi:glycosyltransferase involved in cell wall biosynthesis